MSESHLRFDCRSTPGLQTSVWDIHEQQSGQHLGVVQWFYTGLRYGLFPHPDIVYEPRQLVEIAEFLTHQMRAYLQLKATSENY